MNAKYSRPALAMDCETQDDDRFEFDFSRYVPHINWRAFMSIRAEKFLKRNGILFVCLALLTVWTWTTCTITRHNAIMETEARLSFDYDAAYDEGYQACLDEQSASNLLTGDESKQAAIEDLSEQLAVHVASLRMDRHVTEAGAETYCWVDLARLISGEHGDTLQAVFDEGQIEAYTPGHAVRNEDREITRRVATAYINNEYPDGFTPELQYAEINADGSVTARSKLKTDSTTVFWRIK